MNSLPLCRVCGSSLHKTILKDYPEEACLLIQRILVPAGLTASWAGRGKVVGLVLRKKTMELMTYEFAGTYFS